MTIGITVIGTPAPQGSKKFVGVARSGRGILIESSAKVRPWRQDVKAAALDRMVELSITDGLTGPLAVEMVFTLKKPKSAPKRRRTWPDRTPDLSKLVRSTEDALTDAGVWEDDARVVECIARKVFPHEHELALTVPGVRIAITQVTE